MLDVHLLRTGACSGNRRYRLHCSARFPNWPVDLALMTLHYVPWINDMKGFTLIELVAVLIILGVLAAVAATRLTGTSTISVKGAAEMIQADIRYAQEAAMAENTAKSVIFSPGASSYTVDSENKGLPSGVTIGNNLTVTFNSLGEPTAGGGGSVSISADGQSKTISVSNYTGKVSID
jgi:prepilin-type N-terminal cleavage/methylation domain-containing protein